MPVVTVNPACCGELGSDTNSTIGESGGVRRPTTEGVRGVLSMGEGGAGGGGGDSGSEVVDEFLERLDALVGHGLVHERPQVLGGLQLR